MGCEMVDALRLFTLLGLFTLHGAIDWRSHG